MTTQQSSAFSAADSVLGYLYQLRVALLWALRRLKIDNTFLVSIETLDDVAFEGASGVLTDLLQTKLHRNRETTITDASVDLWKTLRVWIEGIKDNQVPSGTVLQLLTTATAPDGTIAARLRTQNRDGDAALKAMESTAQSSTNKENAAAYAAFLALDLQGRRALVDSIIVLDQAPSTSDLDADLRAEVFWAVDRAHHDAFLQRLEGWWLRRCIKQLTSDDRSDRISGTELEQQMADLREGFKQDALPIDDDVLNTIIDEATYAKHETSNFVRQLELIAASKKRIASAVRDYYRAFEQRSRWVRNDLLHVGECEKYERRLLEHWEAVFEAMKNELGAEVAEAERQRAGRDVLKWAETATLPMRSSVTEPFVSRGSLHMLADEIRLGWHPEFRDKISALLAPKENVA
jgi:hypothetical protein